MAMMSFDCGLLQQRLTMDTKKLSIMYYVSLLSETQLLGVAGMLEFAHLSGQCLLFTKRSDPNELHAHSSARR